MAGQLADAVRRHGKTFSARTIALAAALAAALDPHVRLIVFDDKASPDWRAFAKAAHRIGFGFLPRNGIDPVEHLINALMELKVRCRLQPFGPCRNCDGTGHALAHDRKRGKDCRRCHGHGIRVGHWIYNRAARTYRAGTR